MATLAIGPALTQRGNVSFSVILSSEHPQQFHISQEAFAWFTGSTNAHLLTFLKSHVDKILRIAARKLSSPLNGIILLETKDF